MLDISSTSYRTCDGIHRRGFLKAGALGLAGLGLPDLLRLRAAEAAAGKSPSDTAAILIWCNGGPSHFETFDPKPDAPAEYRGHYKPIPTKLTGENYCELFPKLAQMADRLATIRSCAHKEGGHGSAVKNINTGYLHPPGTNEGTFLYPVVGSVVAKVRENERRQLPHYTAIPAGEFRRGDAAGGAYLGTAFDPFAANPSEGPKTLQLPQELTAKRLQNRKALLTSLDRLRRDADSSGMMEGMDVFTRQAFEMVTGKAARDALDLNMEPARNRERYGSKEERKFSWGQGCLLARRLVEAGVSFVSVSLGGWDDHGKLQQNMERRAPIFDAAISALVEDLYERGLDKKVAVLVWGEFGRTPRVNKNRGRDHWPSSMSVLMAGGGLKVGQVIGSTNEKGERPKNRPLHPNDVLATLYQHLGVDFQETFVNPAGRPIPILPHGKPIAELL